MTAKKGPAPKVSPKVSPKSPARKPNKAGASQTVAADRRVRFAHAYLANGQNARAAAIEVGLSAHTADQAARRYLEHPDVKAIIEARRAELRQELEINTETVLRGLAQQSFFDVRKLFNADGSPKPIQELDDDTAAAIAGLEVIEQYEGAGDSRKFVGYLKKYKLPNKGDNLERLARYLGLFEKDNAQKSMGMLAGLPRDTLKLIVEHIRSLKAGGQPARLA